MLQVKMLQEKRKRQYFQQSSIKGFSKYVTNGLNEKF